MSTSILYHGWGMIGYNYRTTRYEAGAMVFVVQPKGKIICCPECQRVDVTLRGTKTRQFRTLPIGRKRVFIETDMQRIWCPACDFVRQSPLNFADPKVTYTRQLERYILDLLGSMTIQDVAQHLQMSWDTIKEIQKRDLTARFSRPKLRHMQRLAIDEIAVFKGHRYLTVVMDLDSGCVVFVGNGKGADALEPFWVRLKRSGAKIEAVAIDMSPAYIEAVTTNLPHAAVVFDHFHVVKMFNEKLSDLRRDIFREIADKKQRTILKGTRWLLLKNPENLDQSRNEKDRLDDALNINLPLSIAYYLKEDLRQIWSQENKVKAGECIDAWVGKAKASQIRILEKFAQTLESHRYGILAYYRHRISTGPLEGMNNKIKTMKRQAYGFRDMEFFKLRIMAIHEAKHVLVG
ncbi:MAG: ISL3 family transposase [Candidatus Riflebacteria bacterium]|nr:ISL3 family transposase [Candidatus Riflebacteria bacterium]